MAITLKQLLTKVYHNELRCIAGEKGLEKEVLAVNIVDNPEIVSWLYGGELVLSTGYVTKMNPAMLQTLVSELHKKGCVGLGMKVKRFFQEIPQVLIDEGNKYDFPIFEIAYEMRMSDVSRLVYNNLFSNEMSETEKIHTIYSQITRSILSGEDIDRALFDITMVIPNPIILVDDTFSLVAYENPSENDVNISEFLNINYGETVIDDATVNYLLSYYDDTKFRAHTIQVGENDKKYDMAVMTIEIQKQLFGFLMIPQTVTALNYTDFRILESVVSIIGIHLLKTRLESDAVKQSGNNFASNVLFNNHLSNDMIKYYCDIHGFDYTQKRVCLNLEIDNFLDMSFDKRSNINSMTASLKNEIFSRFGLNHFFIQLKNSYIIFVFFQNKMSDIEISMKMREIASAFQAELRKSSIGYSIGISSPGENCIHISQAFKEAIDVVALGKKLYPKQKLFYYQNFIIYLMLRNTMTNEQLYNLYTSIIGALDEYDNQNNTELLYTLEVYLNNHRNITQAASEMHLHRNTMLYRIDKIKDMLMVDFDNPEILLNLQIGIHAKKLLDAYYNN